VWSRSGSDRELGALKVVLVVDFAPARYCRLIASISRVTPFCSSTCRRRDDLVEGEAVLEA
jgi:hypothetical protein